VAWKYLESEIHLRENENPMQIDNLQIEPNLILAPMAGITNLPFRVVCRAGGAGMVWTEMISAKAFRYGDRRTQDMGCIHPDEKPVAAQIFGRDPCEMASAARFLQDRGADLIDINMGCPVKKILKSGSGVQLMREPGLAATIVRDVVGSVSVPVTVKMRLGWSETDENFLELGKIFEDLGAAALILHPRTKLQGFSGKARWEAVAQLVGGVSIPVIGSGDVHTGEDAKRKIESTGCAALMIGRASLGKPWIFQTIHAYITGRKNHFTDIFRPELVQTHMKLLTDYMPGRSSVGHLRKHLAWYSRGFPNSAAFRREINGLTESGEIVALAREFLKLNMEDGSSSTMHRAPSLSREWKVE
jgi:nifR3 family TIM-barrel protein